LTHDKISQAKLPPSATSVTYGFDNARNLKLNAGVSLGYNNNESLQTVGAATVGSDGDGNQLADISGNALSWNSLSQLEKFSTNETYTYDAIGRLTRITNGVNVTQLVYRGLTSEVIEELNGSNAVVRSYAWDSIGRQLYVKVGTSVYYEITNPHGDVVAYATAAAIAGTQHFDAWGNPTYAPSGVSTPFGYQGAVGSLTDAATGMVLMGARWYYPKVGRFLTSDPAASSASRASPADSLRWDYVANRPLIADDASGYGGGTCTSPGLTLGPGPGGTVGVGVTLGSGSCSSTGGLTCQQDPACAAQAQAYARSQTQGNCTICLICASESCSQRTQDGNPSGSTGTGTITSNSHATAVPIPKPRPIVHEQQHIIYVDREQDRNPPQRPQIVDSPQVAISLGMPPIGPNLCTENKECRKAVSEIAKVVTLAIVAVAYLAWLCITNPVCLITVVASIVLEPLIEVGIGALADVALESDVVADTALADGATASGAGDTPVVIGQGMGRVLSAADDLAADTYGGVPLKWFIRLLPRGMRDAIYAWHNTRWLIGVMNAGRLIIDIGPDGRVTTSAWDMEQGLIASRGYTNIIRLWDDQTICLVAC
jgi:RHS repeat-associated protein